MPQRCGRLEVRVLDDAAQAHVGLLAPAAPRQENAHHVVEGVGMGQVRGGHVESRGELFRRPVEQQAGTALGRDHQKLGPYDRNDPSLLDEAQQVLPRVVIERGDGQAYR